MKGLVSTQKQRMVSALSPYRSFNVNHHSLDSIAQLFIDRKQPKIDDKLRIVDKNYFERTDGNIKGLIATIEATEAHKLILILQTKAK